MAKKVLVPIADGIEEIEAVCIIDVMRRAGAEVTVASVSDLQVTASRGVNIVADRTIGECVGLDWDLIVLPGGMPGAENLRDSGVVKDLLGKQMAQGKLYGAICAAPAVVLAHHGFLEDRKATAHPAFSHGLDNQDEVASRVVVDGNCVTSRGPGTAIEFALQLVAEMFGEDKAREVAEPMLVR